MSLLPKTLTESQGWTTHFHCQIGLVICILGIIAVIVGAGKVVGVLGFVALANVFCAVGCLRQKLQAMKQ